MRRAALILVVLVGLGGLNVLGAPPVVKTINGNPLTINIGEEASFQIFNSAISATGQIFPPSVPCSGEFTADMGVFVQLGSLLYGPRFSDHCISATPFASLPNYRAWVPVSITDVTGSGSATDPFIVIVVLSAAGPPDLQLTMTVVYINGDGFFLNNLDLSSSTGGSFDAFLGADLYLADSDSGIPYLHTPSGSVGGQTCVSPPYVILLIPLSQADGYTGTDFASVWSQIASGTLNNTVDTICEDDGAAVSWMNRSIPAGGTTSLLTAASFGAIPPIVSCGGTPDAPVSPAISPEANPAGPVTATDYLTYAWSAPASGPVPAGYRYHINSDPPASTTETSVTDVPPLGLRADVPITLNVLAFACSPEVDGPEAQSPTYSLAAPGASFSASAASAAVGQTVNFTDTSSPQATSWYWFFGDDGSSTEQNPAHAFTAAGLYAVYEIASNGSGSSVSAPQAISIGGSAIHPASMELPGDSAQLQARGDGAVHVLPEPAARPVLISPRFSREWNYPGLTLLGRSRHWLRLQSPAPGVVYVRFEREGVLLTERRLVLPGDEPVVVDLGAYRANHLPETIDVRIVAGLPVAASLSEERP